MTRRLSDERGAVMALAAVLIPVFLVLTALVVETGNWFTHDRQLQNRADAAAYAAGIEYAKHWRECVQSSDPDQQRIAAQKIANAARQFAGNPDAADYTDLDPSGAVPATLYNDQIASQDPVQANNNLDVVINSANNDYTDDQDYTDDYDGAATTRNGTPCFPHPTDPENLSDTDPPVQWTDVKVTERDTGAVFFWEGLAPDLHGRARVEVRPSASGNGFLPLAVPNNNITQVQIRYYDECRNTLIPNSTYDLKPLPAEDQAAWLALGKGVLWGLPNLDPTRPDEGDRRRWFRLAVPSYDPSCGDYLAVGVEVRLASRDFPEVDLDAPCATLAASKFADCFRRISQIRVWNDGLPDSQPRIRDVRLIGGCPDSDGYFGTLPAGAIDCQYEVEADVDWGSRDDDNRNVDANFTVEANGVNMSLMTPLSEQSGIYRTDSPVDASPGANNVAISLDWDDNNPMHEWPAGTSCGGNRCEYSATESVHRSWVGTRANAGAVELVRSSSGNFVTVPAGVLPGPPRDNVNDGGVTIDIYPTVATRALLRTGTLVTLRLDDPQENQTLQCDPAVTSGRVFESFRYGCQPYYDDNKWNDAAWWNATTKTCPPSSAFFSYSTMPPPYGLNGNGNPWRCVPTAQSMRPPTIGEGMAAATGNCDRFVNNQCQQVRCLVQGDYEGWTQNSDSNHPRVVNLFVIPYQSLKGVVGNDPEETVPIYGFASFYVMNWTGQNASNSDLCPDRFFGSEPVPDPPPGAAVGVFVEAINYESGPVDEEAVCVEGMMERCRAVLVR